MYSIYLDKPISCMILLASPKSKSRCVLVALKNGEVRTYNGKTLINSFECGAEVVGMCFGTFGREEGTLVVSLQSGGMIVKMLSRTADLERNAQGQTAPGPPPEQDIPLDVRRGIHLFTYC